MPFARAILFSVRTEIAGKSLLGNAVGRASIMPLELCVVAPVGDERGTPHTDCGVLKEQAPALGTFTLELTLLGLRALRLVTLAASPASK